MKKVKLTILLWFIIAFFPKNICAQLIDGVTFIPASFQFITSEANSPLQDNMNASGGVSIKSQIILQKEINRNIDFFLGLGHDFHYENIRIAKRINTFAELADFSWTELSDADTVFRIKSVNYFDSYLIIPIGCRFYTRPKDEKGIKFTFSTKLELAFLVQSNSKVVVNQFSSNAIFATRVENSTYEEEAEHFFQNKNKIFSPNFQLGFGYDWRVGNHFSFGHEIVMNAFFRKHKIDFLKKKKALGLQLRLVFHLE